MALLRKQPRPKKYSSWLFLIWRQDGSTLSPHLLVMWSAQKQTICLCSLSQPHPFTRCWISSSGCVLTVSLHRSMIQPYVGSSWRAAAYGKFGKDDIMWEGPHAGTGKEKKLWNKVKELGPAWSLHSPLSSTAQRKKKVDR